MLFDLDGTLVDQESAAAAAAAAVGWAAEYGVTGVEVAAEWAVVSEKHYRRYQRFKLERLGLAAEIDLLIAGDTLPAGKPDPRAFAHALQRLDAAPHDVMMVGDSLTNDVRGARAVGIDAVLVDRSGRHAQAGVPRVRSLVQVLDVVRR
ncbi:HAD family hydrolase [Kribbella sp. HUAS MG21]|uniref:HAD family hydrolase n=1 Tax=Kribbella sp. HUAS MG21 TaxID=3160966 RepID=A0AAU7TQC9_9ACTN